MESLQLTSRSDMYLFILEFTSVHIRKPVMLFFVSQEKRTTKGDYCIMVIFCVFLMFGCVR